MMMKKIIFLVVFLLSFFFLVTPAKASIISIDKNGNIIWKILAYESPLALEIPKQNVEVKNVTSTNSSNREISLSKEDGKVSLKVGDAETLDVTNMGDSLVEIEERGDIKKIEIGITEENKDVSYLIAGDRVINLFNLIKINIPVTTKISASTGEILSVEQPMWLKVLGFMFS